MCAGNDGDEELGSFGIDLACARETADETLRNRGAEWATMYAFQEIWSALGLYFMDAKNRSLWYATGEIWADNMASFFNILHGFYKPACHALRSILELTFGAVFYDRCPHEASGYARTNVSSDAKTVGFARARKRASALPEIVNYDRAVGHRRSHGEAIARLYRRACRYSHSHPSRWDSWRWRDIVPRFSEKAFDQWAGLAHEVNRKCLLTVCLIYPSSFKLIYDGEFGKLDHLQQVVGVRDGRYLLSLPYRDHQALVGWRPRRLAIQLLRDCWAPSCFWLHGPQSLTLLALMG